MQEGDAYVVNSRNLEMILIFNMYIRHWTSSAVERKCLCNNPLYACCYWFCCTYHPPHDTPVVCDRHYLFLRSRVYEYPCIPGRLSSKMCKAHCRGLIFCTRYFLTDSDYDNSIERDIRRQF